MRQKKHSHKISCFKYTAIYVTWHNNDEKGYGLGHCPLQTTQNKQLNFTVHILYRYTSRVQQHHQYRQDSNVNLELWNLTIWPIKTRLVALSIPSPPKGTGPKAEPFSYLVLRNLSRRLTTGRRFRLGATVSAMPSNESLSSLQSILVVYSNICRLQLIITLNI